MRRLLIIAGAAVLATIGTAAAQNRAQTSAAVRQLGDYIRTPDHLKVVGMAIATFEPTALAATCKDVKPVKGRSFVMHAGRYLGALTRCKSSSFETCTKRTARQSGFGA